MSGRITIDVAGAKAALNSPEMAQVLQEVAEAIAAKVSAQSIMVGDEDGGPGEVALPVRVDADAGSARVTLAHPSGQAVQAKHGALTKAAAAAGLPARAT